VDLGLKLKIKDKITKQILEKTIKTKYRKERRFLSLPKAKSKKKQQFLNVNVDSHKRKSHKRKLKSGETVIVKGSSIKAHNRRIKDRGTKGKGKPVIPKLQKGRMTKLAQKYGYISGSQTINDIPQNKMDDFTRDLVLKEGLSERTVNGMFQAQIVYRKRDKTEAGREFKQQMQKGQKELKDIPNKAKIAKIRKKYPKLKDWQLDPNQIKTSKVQLYKGSTMLSADLTREQARKAVRAGRAFVITDQAIQFLD
jgi:hypothetical protein